MYFNTLIIMNEDTSGYGRRSRSPSGYCKLAMPNRVICYVQGLQQLPKGQVYRLYLMSKGQQRSVEVGMFQVGAGGNREIRWTITPGDINNSGMTAAEIDGALVIVDGEGTREPAVPLVGFASEPYSWKDIISPSKEEAPKITQVEPILVVKEEEVVQVAEELVVEELGLAEAMSDEIMVEELGLAEAMSDEVIPDELVLAEATRDEVMLEELASLEGAVLEPEEIMDEVVSLREEIQRLNKIVEQSNRAIESLQRNLAIEEPEPEPEPGPEPEPEPSQPSTLGTLEELARVRDVKEDLEAFISRFQSGSKKAHKVSNEPMEKLFATRIPMNPFPDSNDGVKWVRITHEDLGTLSQLPPEWANQSFILDAHRKYKHLILGKDETGLVYYIGVPGVFSPDENYILETDRIERFSCRYNVPLKTGEIGYWIALM